MSTLCLKIPYSNNNRPDRDIEFLKICSETPVTAQLWLEARIAMVPPKSWYKLRYPSNALSISCIQIRVFCIKSRKIRPSQVYIISTNPPST
jgi:hypothetical protein